MTGNIRQGLGLLVVALIAALFALLARGNPVGEAAAFGALMLGVIGLVKIAVGLLKPEPARD